MEDGNSVDLFLGLGGTKLPHQTIKLKGKDPYESVALKASEVFIHPSVPNHTDSSPSLKVRNIVDAQWEKTYHNGNLIAMDDNGIFLAYGMRVPGKANGVVRIIHRPTNQRFLLKGFRGVIRDVQFSHTKDALYSAAVDEFGIAMVHEIVVENGSISYPLLFQIERPVTEATSEYRRVVWCPYIPDPDAVSGVDPAKLLLLLSDNQAEVWHIPTVCANQVSLPVILSPYEKPVNEGLIRILGLGNATLVDGSLSPDGSAVAIASMDGNVYFFQFNLTAWTASKVHVWEPHGGKPLSSLHFLDDTKNPKADEQYWKYAITGANNNSEIKMWYCDTWKCRQTIYLQSNTGINQLKAKLDRSASFLLLSDIQNRLLFVFNLSSDETQASILAMTQFNLRFPMISYHVLDAGWKKHKRGGYGQNGEETDAERDEEEEYQQVVVIDLVFIQPNSLQECQVVFQPDLPAVELYRNMDSLSTLSTSLDVGICLDTSSSSEPELAFQSVNESSFSASANALDNHFVNASNLSSILMPPDAFHSPNRTGTESVQSNKTVVPESSSPTDLFGPNPVQAQQDMLALSSPRSTSKMSNIATTTAVSGGSSPSREVEDILNPQPMLPKPLEPSKPLANYSPGIDRGAALLNAMAGLNSNMASAQDNQTAPATSNKLDQLFSALEINRDVDNTVGWSPNIAVGKTPDFEPVPMPMANQQLQAMDRNVNLLVQLMRSQQETIEGLRKQVQENVTGTQGLRKELEEMRRVSASVPADQFGRLETFIQTNQEHSQQVLLNTVSQTVVNALNFKVENLLKSEMAAISAEFARSLEPMRKQFAAERAQFLGSLEICIKDQVIQLVKSKSLVDEWSQTMSNTLQPVVLRSVKDTLATHVVPSFEKLCQNLFGQLNDVMSKGLKELFQAVENQMDKSRRIQDKSKDQAREQITAATEKLSSVGEQMKALINVEMGTINQAIIKLPEQINGRVTASLRDEMTRLGKEHRHSLEGAIAAVQDAVVRAGTPAPVPSSPATPATPSIATLKQMLATGRTVEAFQAALSAIDLKILTSVCELVDPQTLFSSQVTPLPQYVLLSLIQQLSSDLSTGTDLKLKYLKEALMVLDPEDPQLRGHVHGVVSSLIQQLECQVSLHARSPKVKELRMLQMMAQSVLSKL